MLELWSPLPEVLPAAPRPRGLPDPPDDPAQAPAKAGGSPTAWRPSPRPVQETFARVHRGALGLWTTYLEWKALRADNRAPGRGGDRPPASPAPPGRAGLGERAAAEPPRPPRAPRRADDRAPRWSPGTGTASRGASPSTAAAVTAWSGSPPVIVTRGVVGRVLELRHGSAVVQLVTDPASSIGGVVNRTRAQGLIEGVAGGRMRLKLTAREDGVMVGDLVSTAGGRPLPQGPARSDGWRACTRPAASSASSTSSRRWISPGSRKCWCCPAGWPPTWPARSRTPEPVGAVVKLYVLAVGGGTLIQSTLVPVLGFWTRGARPAGRPRRAPGDAPRLRRWAVSSASRSASLRT